MTKIIGLTVLVTTLAASCFAKSKGKTAPPEVSHGALAKFLPMAFAPVLREVKAKSRIPILLPRELPGPIGRAKFAHIDKAEATEYAISLYFELGIGDAGFAAFFAA
ncbi:MAG TPA: hypothetical protein VF283_16900 [Bryobacteraceae bacterium]